MGKVLKTVAIAAVVVASAVYGPQIALAVFGPSTASAAAVAAGTAGAALTATAAATAITTIALSLAAGVAFKALGLTPKVGQGGAASAAGVLTNYRQTISASQIIYGKRRVGGMVTFFHSKTDGGEDYRYFVITICGHPIEDVLGFYLSDTLVTVDGSDMVTSGPYASNAWLWVEKGSASATADATFVAECDGKWTTDHRGRGITKLFGKFRLTDAVISEGLPVMTVEVEGKNDIADPRDDSTGYTTNASLVFYDWMRMTRAEGGFGAAADEVDDEHVIAEANICDEDVDLTAGGTEKRYSINAVIVTGGEPDELRDRMVAATAGYYTYSEGLHVLQVGSWRPVVHTITYGQLRGPLQVSAFASGNVAANEVRAVFVDPAANYQPADITPIEGDAGIDSERVADFDLPFTTSNAAAQRICRIALARAAAERTVSVVMGIEGLAIQSLDNVQLSVSDYGLDNYAWKVAGWNLNPDWTVNLSLIEDNADIYEDVPDTVPPAAPGTITQPVGIEVGMGDAPSGLAAVADSATQITASFTMPTTATVFTFEIYKGTTAVFASATLAVSDLAAPGFAVSEPITGLTTATDYYFWARARLTTGGYSPLAGPVNETTL